MGFHMSFTCPKCHRTSYNPNDERAGYCGNCHEFTGTPHYEPYSTAQPPLKIPAPEPKDDE